MIVPGLPRPSVDLDIHLAYGVSQNDVDVFIDAGSPVGARKVFITVESGVVIGSTSTANSAMDASGFASGSQLSIIMVGRIQGMGGAGGRGGDGFTSGATGTTLGGGGGGGAGTNAGAGGAATSTAVVGDPGTDAAGGVAGSNVTVGSALYVAGSVGFDGGHALETGSLETTIDNFNGEIWGGGGGGGGGGHRDGFPASEPAAGGGPGQSSGVGGAYSPFFSSPGNAVKGSDVTFTSGASSPQTEGPVSA